MKTMTLRQAKDLLKDDVVVMITFDPIYQIEGQHRIHKIQATRDPYRFICKVEFDNYLTRYALDANQTVTVIEGDLT